MARIGVDACFVIALYDPDDQHHDTAVRQFDALFGPESARHQLAAPWPILYECLGTRFARNTRNATILNRLWTLLDEADQLVLLDDCSFRDPQLQEQLAEGSRPLSLVDRVLRAMIFDKERLFDYFLTYNSSDFLDACQAGNIPLINERSTAESYGI